MCWKTNSAAIRKALVVLAFAVLFCTPFQSAFAQSILRDAEIEYSIREMTNPILRTAGINPKDVRIFLIGDPRVNAFVAGGLNIFIHSGLIKATKHAGMLMGVIAHETGHIDGAHLSKLREIANRASIGSIISAVIGAAAAVGGGGDVGVGILAGGQGIAQRKLLTDIRINEQSADHAALRYLDALGISASGVRDMFKVLRRQERGRNINPYNITHPLSTERIATVRAHLAASPIKEGQIPARYEALHKRMRAKLLAFTETFETTMKEYPESDTSVAARQARAVAYYRNNQIDKARAQMQALVDENPKDAFLYDTMGQILFEFGRVKEAEFAYSKANDLYPNSALIMTAYARTLLVQENTAKTKQALNLLEQATILDKTHTFAWRQLATAYGKLGRLGESYLALANESAAQGNYTEVKALLKRAKPLLEPGSVAEQKALDLEIEATQNIKQQENS